MSGLDEQRIDHLLPFTLFRKEGWICNGELAYWHLIDEQENVIGRFYRPLLFYEDKSEECLIEFFGVHTWANVFMLQCPKCSVKLYNYSDDWIKLIKYVNAADESGLIKYQG